LAFCCSIAGAATGTYTDEASFASVTDLKWRLEASWSTSIGDAAFSPIVWETRWTPSPPGTLNGSVSVGAWWKLANMQSNSPATPVTVALEAKAAFVDGAGQPLNPARLSGNELHDWYISWYFDATDTLYPRTEYTPLVRISESSLTKSIRFYDELGVPADFNQGSTGWGYNYATGGDYCDERDACDKVSPSYTMKMEVVFVPGSYLYASSDPNCKDVSCMPMAYDVMGTPSVQFIYQVVTQVVPEPSQWALLAFGIAALALRRRPCRND